MTSNDSAISFQVKVEKKSGWSPSWRFHPVLFKSRGAFIERFEWIYSAVCGSPPLSADGSQWSSPLFVSRFLSCDSSRSNIFIYLYSSIILTWLRQRFKSWSRDLGVAIHASEAGRCSLLQVSCRLWFTRWRRTNWGAEETKGALTAITAALFKGRL